MDLAIALPDTPAVPQGTVTKFLPNPCCAGGWWLRAEVPSDEDAQPETD